MRPIDGPFLGIMLLLAASDAAAARRSKPKTRTKAETESVKEARPASGATAAPASSPASVEPTPSDSATRALTPTPLAASAPVTAPALIAPLRAPAPAGKKPAPIGIGATIKGGVLVPTNKLVTTATIGGEVRERFPFLHRVLALSVDFDYFEPRLSGNGSSPAVSGAYTYQVSARALALGVDVLAFLPLDWLVDLYGGVGYGAFFYDLSSKAFGATQSEIQVRHGLRVRAGMLWPFWRPLYGGVEVLYQYTAFDFLITGTSNAGTVVATLFVGFEL